MNTLALHVADWFFLIFHTALTLFNLCGWFWPATRRAHVVCMSMTAISWFVLGIFYGIGYCVCTDWHFQVLEALGEKNLPYSYITYIIRRWTGLRAEDAIIVPWTGVAFSVVLAATVYVNVRDHFQRDK